MQTKVIIRENSWRLEKFQTKTILVAENGHQVIWKCPITEAALPFINAIADREKASREYLKGHFDVLCGDIEDGCLKYDYLPNKSLMQIIEMQFQQDSPSMADKTIKAYVDKIKALQSIYTVPEEFYQIIGLDGAYDNTKLLCLCRGLLDLTPRNIFVSDSEWMVIDSEWSFDFPVPMIFVLFRAIREMAVMLQPEIRLATNPSNPAHCLFARGLNTYYVPASWRAYLVGGEVGLNQMLRWEMGFQRYVSASNCRSVGRIVRTPKTRTKFSARACTRRRHLATAAKKFLAGIPGLKAVFDSFEKRLFQKRI